MVVVDGNRYIRIPEKEMTVQQLAQKFANLDASEQAVFLSEVYDISLSWPEKGKAQWEGVESSLNDRNDVRDMLAQMSGLLKK